MKVPTSSLHAHPLNAQIYRDESDEALLESIKKNGILVPLVVSGNLVISGNRRLDAARKLGIEEVPVVHLPETDGLGLEVLLIESNRYRIKTNEQIGREYLHLKKIESERARIRMAVGVSAGSLLGKARDIAAKKLGIGEAKAEMAGSVVKAIDSLRDAGDDFAAERLRRTMNEKSVARAYSLLPGRKARMRSDESSVSSCRECMDVHRNLLEANKKLLRENMELREEISRLKNSFPLVLKKSQG